MDLRIMNICIWWHWLKGILANDACHHNSATWSTYSL